MWNLFVYIYAFFVTLPDRFYPFANEINGKRIRGMRSYKKAVARALRKNGGMGRLGYKLNMYRQAFHFAGSILVIVIATLLSDRFLGSEVALYVLLFMAIAALTYQEFYLHPRRYGQHIRKGALDWLVWVTPILVYLFY